MKQNSIDLLPRNYDLLFIFRCHYHYANVLNAVRRI